MSSVVILLALTSVAAQNVTVATLDGKSATGELLSVTNDGVEVATSAGKQTFSAQNLATVRFPTVPVRPVGKVQVHLADGSRLQGSDFRLTSGQAVLVGLDGKELAMSRRAIAWVRFAGTNSTSTGNWQQALETKAAGDLLIVRKSAMGEGGVSRTFFDPLEGVVNSVNDATLGFQFDGDAINVKREKVEGIVFFKPATPANQPLACQVISSTWGTLHAATIGSKDGVLQVKTLSGVSLKLAYGAGTTLDFRAGNIQWLAETEPDNTTSSFHLQPPGMTFGFNDLFRPQSEGPFGSIGLKLGKQTFESGLAVHSPTTLTYRVPGGFSQFRATIGLADEAAAGADVQVRIMGDGADPLWEGTFSAKELVEPVQVQCKLANVRRMTIIVADAQGLDFGDSVILGDARFVK